MIRSFAFQLAMIGAVVTTPLIAQRPYVTVSGGQMEYDGGGSRWFPTVTVGLGIPVAARVRVGILGTHSSLSFDPDEVTGFAPNSVTRALAFGEWDAVTFSAHGVAVYLRGGVGYVHTAVSAGSDRFPEGSLPDVFDQRATNGLAASFGLGLRAPIVSRVALNGGLDFHDDQIMRNTTGKRDWAWSVGIAVTP